MVSVVENLERDEKVTKWKAPKTPSPERRSSTGDFPYLEEDLAAADQIRRASPKKGDRTPAQEAIDELNAAELTETEAKNRGESRKLDKLLEDVGLPAETTDRIFKLLSSGDTDSTSKELDLLREMDPKQFQNLKEEVAKRAKHYAKVRQTDLKDEDRAILALNEVLNDEKYIPPSLISADHPYPVRSVAPGQPIPGKEENALGKAIRWIKDFWNA